jgi:hypothetical protein
MQLHERWPAEARIRRLDFICQLQARFVSEDLFSLYLISQDFTERWYGEFTGAHIEDVTRRSGALKNLPVFWKMVCNAGRRRSNTVSLEVAVPSETLQSLSKLSEEKVYVILTQTTEFDRVKYPMQLRPADFKPDELVAMIRRLFAENLMLKTRITMPDSVQSLGRPVVHLNQTLVQMKSEKDNKIDQLQKKLHSLQSSPKVDPTRRRPRAKDSSLRMPQQLCKSASGTRRCKTPKHHQWQMFRSSVEYGAAQLGLNHPTLLLRSVCEVARS